MNKFLKAIKKKRSALRAELYDHKAPWTCLKNHTRSQAKNHARKLLKMSKKFEKRYQVGGWAYHVRYGAQNIRLDETMRAACIAMKPALAQMTLSIKDAVNAMAQHVSTQMKSISPFRIELSEHELDALKKEVLNITSSTRYLRKINLDEQIY